MPHHVHNVRYPAVPVNYLITTNKMQRYTIFFIPVKALRVSGSFSPHHQELKTVHTASGVCQACFTIHLLALPYICLLYHTFACFTYIYSWVRATHICRTQNIQCLSWCYNRVWL